MTMAEAAAGLRRLRPALRPDVCPLVSLLISQCDNWETGNQAEMRPRMEDNIQAIERALAGGSRMSDEMVRCILRNQIEIMDALSLLLRYAQPELIGKAGELDSQRDDLFQRHRATALALSNGER